VNLQLLAEDLRDEDQSEADTRRRSLIKVGAIRHEAERLRHLLDDFLQMAGPCRLERKRVDLNKTVEHLAEFFSPQAAGTNVRLRVDCAEGPLECLLDEHLIEQALLNLLINAQQAMPDGGEVIVRTWRDSDETAGVEVSDTGPGITREEQARVFEAFYSTKAHGTGLGLSTAQRIVSEHGGQLDLHSEPGRGTCFTIRLPLSSAPE
jgi:signal transduction histidine kinase